MRPPDKRRAPCAGAPSPELATPPSYATVVPSTTSRQTRREHLREEVVTAALAEAAFALDQHQGRTADAIEEARARVRADLADALRAAEDALRLVAEVER